MLLLLHLSPMTGTARICRQGVSHPQGSRYMYISSSSGCRILAAVLEHDCSADQHDRLFRHLTSALVRRLARERLEAASSSLHCLGLSLWGLMACRVRRACVQRQGASGCCTKMARQQRVCATVPNDFKSLAATLCSWASWVAACTCSR